MAQLKLFGEEAKELTKDVVIEKEAKPKRTRTTTKELTETDLKYEISKSKSRIKELEAQDETNWDDFDVNIKGKAVNIPLVRNHIRYYSEKLGAKREPRLPLLTKWRTFIIDLCKEKGHEIDKIWFDDSAPYDCEVAVRLKEHRCWSSCVKFRFAHEKLKAYDSHFGGGTSFVSLDTSNPNCEQDLVRQVMEKVFNKECSNSGWENDFGEHRNIEINEQGYLQ